MVSLFLLLFFSFGQVTIADDCFYDYEQLINVEDALNPSALPINPLVSSMVVDEPEKENPYSYDPVKAYSQKDLPLGTLYTPGDFNGDGRTDLVVTTSTGSYWWISTGLNNDYNPQCDYYRSDLTLGKVKFVAGDFNGDGKSDLIVITNLGSDWYLSKADGFKYKPEIIYSDSNLVLGKISYYLGNFNGDTKTDLLAVTPNGSFWYYSEGDVSSYFPRLVYTREDLILGKVLYTIANFAGDIKSDFILTTVKGSEWYLSTGSLENYLPVSKYFRSDLVLNKVKFTVGNFAGDTRQDLIITDTSGSTWYISAGKQDEYQHIDAYFRGDLSLGKVLYFPWSNFSGDNRGDLVCVTATGSEWYITKSNENEYLPIVAYQNDKLTLNNVWYYPGNYGGEHHTDTVAVTPEGSTWYITTLKKN